MGIYFATVNKKRLREGGWSMLLGGLHRDQRREDIPATPRRGGSGEQLRKGSAPSNFLLYNGLKAGWQLY